MRATGQIAYWKADKNFGFIRSGAAREQGHDGDVFLHGNDILDDGYQPREGDQVSFRLTSGADGKPKAREASFPAATETTLKITRSVYVFSLFQMLVVVMTGLFVYLFFFRAEMFLPIMIYFVMSVITYVAYLIDKSRAIAGKGRMPEVTLHVFEFFGGWPGAYAAQMAFRHKSSKPGFQRIFRAIVALHAGAWIYTLAGGPLPSGLPGFLSQFFAGPSL